MPQRNPVVLITLLVSLALLGCLGATPLYAEEPETAARLYSKEGTVEVRRAGSAVWQEAESGAVFRAEDAVRTGNHSRAGLLFAEGVLVRLGSLAMMRFGAGQPTSRPVDLDSGEAYFFSRKPKRYPEIKTPTVSAAVRGTEFVIRAAAQETVISVIAGAVEASNRFGSVRLGSGEKAAARAGAAPIKSILVSPYDAVQWAIHYPNLISPGDLSDFLPGASPKQRLGWDLLRERKFVEAGAQFSGKDWRDALGRALALGARKGAALDELESFRGEAGAGFRLFQGALYLQAGQVEAAERTLRQAAEAAGQAPIEARSRLLSAVAAQKALIAVSRGETQSALALAQSAAEKAPGAPSAALALAYAEQSGGRLEEAREALNRALSANPGDSRPLSRLAEIELGFGEIEAAEDLLSRALRADASDAYARTILGFVALFKNEVDRAASEFSQAVALDPGAALPHLGMGLIRIRRGDSAAGRAEISQAVQLEPRAGIYRSYLGKAFFEDEDEDLAGSEYERAIDLDPRDPTPYLYRGFNELSQNRPVAALEDVEKSIELNDNRAVYRSRLLLDRDLGTRSAGLAQVFKALGFEEAARVEAIKSVNRDYGNYSAHRLLSESNVDYYAESAVAERHIANLLAPLSFNMFNSTGGEASLSDYSALFDKNERRSGLSYAFDSLQNDHLGEAFQSGKSEPFGYFMEATSELGDGTMRNSHLRDYRLNLAGQYEPDYRSKVLAEAYSRFIDQKELDGTAYTEQLPFSLSLGYSNKTGAASQWIFQSSVDRGIVSDRQLANREVNVIAAQNAAQLGDPEILTVIRDYESHLTRWRTGGQYLFDSKWLSSAAGLQVFYLTASQDENSPVVLDEAGYFDSLERELKTGLFNQLDSETVYLYNNLHLARWLDLNLGFSQARVETARANTPPFSDGVMTRNRFNPKAGVTLYPLPELTLRAAYFETLQLPSAADPSSLEPTLVGGINQRLSETSGMRSDNFGLGADYKLAGSSYLGSEWLRRNISEDLGDIEESYVFDFDQGREYDRVDYLGRIQNHADQDVVRSYLYQILSPGWTAGFDQLFALSCFTDPDIDQRLETQRLRFTLRYFDPSGIFVYGRGAWREQRRRNSFYFDDGTDSFPVFDAALGYRLPKRHGSLQLQFLNITGQDFDYDNSIGFEEYVPQDFTVRLAAAVNF